MTDRIEALERLAKLRTDGVLTEDEFTAQKAMLGNAAAGDQLAAAQQTNGARRFLPLLWGFALVAIVLAGIYLLTRDQTLEDPRELTANEAAPALAAPPAPSEASGNTPADTPRASADATDFMFTDHFLANDRPTWEDLGEGPEILQFCVGDPASLANAKGKVMHLRGGFQETDVKWTIGTVKPEATITFPAGDEPGDYYISSLDDGEPLAAYTVVACDAAGVAQ